MAPTLDLEKKISISIKILIVAQVEKKKQHDVTVWYGLLSSDKKNKTTIFHSLKIIYHYFYC